MNGTTRVAVAGGTGTVGRFVVQALLRDGHDVVVLTRSTGVDLVSGAGLAGALTGVDAVVDASSVQTQSARESERFFGTVTRNLLDAESRAGVRHHVTLGIVGSDRASHGYYAGKAVQERLVEEGAVPWTILRATQFHEFARQVHGQVRLGPVVLVPVMRSRPVAARTVGDRLARLAVADPAGRVPDLAGPREERLPDLVRSLAAATGLPGRVVAVPLPGGFGRALRDGTILPGRDAVIDGPTFDEWLRGG
ncbi:NAD-dependent epimerase/dehydratase family protein [Labedella phragmitis]|uniref:NAD-dependent epimerase/dehydratase family protein n=1 Tax=Labedella phragmitis TaxID=2498849 RepID=A0A3S4A792_9MICO|nr:NAD(P)H-binding protein [Labedella phragmitis]RWZ53083.1 NAD-dependent epimerase/dehydratase family protein [Labedella phragmitis]